MGLARAFFSDVREAALDAERCKVQLDAMETRARFGSSNGIHERVSTSSNGVERRTINYINHHDQLEKRRDRDFALIDRACVVLYGDDQMGNGGLCALNPRWADICWWFYCAGVVWTVVANNTGISKRKAQICRNDALKALDRLGLVPSEW